MLLIFGNPPLGTQFIRVNANAGLDWPVRLLVFENDKGEVWTAYTDFDWIARRHGIKNRSDQFKMASTVIAVRYRVQSQSAFPFAVRPMNAAHRYGIAAAGA